MKNRLAIVLIATTSAWAARITGATDEPNLRLRMAPEHTVPQAQTLAENGPNGSFDDEKFWIAEDKYGELSMCEHWGCSVSDLREVIT
jgi:hypothetical protein